MPSYLGRAESPATMVDCRGSNAEATTALACATGRFEGVGLSDSATLWTSDLGSAVQSIDHRLSTIDRARRHHGRAHEVPADRERPREGLVQRRAGPAIADSTAVTSW